MIIINFITTTITVIIIVISIVIVIPNIFHSLLPRSTQYSSHIQITIVSDVHVP